MGTSEHPHLDPSPKPPSGWEPSAQHTGVNLTALGFLSRDGMLADLQKGC